MSFHSREIVATAFPKVKRRKESIMNNIKRLLSILYPPSCPVCGTLLVGKEREAGFCRKCMKEVVPVTEPSCKKCGKLIGDAGAEYCEDCAGGGSRHLYTQGKCLFLYDGPMRGVMYRFKYGNKRFYARSFAACAVRNHSDWIRRAGIDIILPVPMYRGKEKARGYNQAAVFAKALSEATGIPATDSILIRTVNTVPMKGLSDSARRRNLKNAFHMQSNLVQFKRVLLVDDIYTTGTTVDAAAACLLEGGADAVYCMYICAGDGRRRRIA